MFEQYNLVQKIMRIVIYVVLTYIILTFIPDKKINTEDICKLVCAMTFVFLIYDFYYPTVRVELESEDK